MSKKEKPVKNENYFLQRDEKNIGKIRLILDQLPRFVSEYFIGIQMKTSTLTRLNYSYDLRIFFDYLSVNTFNKPIKDITLNDLSTLKASDIEVYLDYLTSYQFNQKRYRCGEQGKSRKLACLRSFFKYFFNKDKLNSNVVVKVAMPKIHDKPIIRLEADEVAKLLDCIESDVVEGLSNRENIFHNLTKKRDLAMISLFLGTGIRISELVGLNTSDVDFETNSFRVTRKGGNVSILYFSDEIAKPLINYIDGVKDDSPLFKSIQGKRITVRAVQNLVKKYSKLITPLKKITPHKLRSTFGTELYRNTQDIYVVADVLGHKDINTTKKHYASISDEIRKNASRAIKLRDEN